MCSGVNTQEHWIRVVLRLLLESKFSGQPAQVAHACSQQFLAAIHRVMAERKPLGSHGCHHTSGAAKRYIFLACIENVRDVLGCTEPDISEGQEVKVDVREGKAASGR